MKSKPGTDILLLAILFLVLMASCNSNPADDRLLQMETIIGKWENELATRTVGFDDLVYIQADITALDVDQAAFETNYGSISAAQQKRLSAIRERFKNLMHRGN